MRQVGKLEHLRFGSLRCCRDGKVRELLDESRPAVSIIIALERKNEESISCFHSVLEQTFTDYELLIVDAGASERTKAFYSEMRKRVSEPFKYIVGKSQNKTAMLNEAIAIAKGTYLLFLNDCDSLRFDGLSILYDSITQNNGDFAYSAYRDFYYFDNGKHSYTVGAKKLQSGVSVEDAPWVLRNAGFSETGKLYSKELVVGNGIQFSEDYGSFSGFAFLKECQLNSHSTVSVSHSIYNRRENAEEADVDFMMGQRASSFPSTMDHLLDVCDSLELGDGVKKELMGSAKSLFNRFAYLRLSQRALEEDVQAFDVYYDYIVRNDPSWRSTLCAVSPYSGIAGKVQRRIVTRKKLLKSLLFGDAKRLHGELMPKKKRGHVFGHTKKRDDGILAEQRSRILSETGSDYLFTVVVPIYNVEPYLEETLDSIVGQTVGFRDNIQLVLVNDGSPDDSGAICRRYLERYPENVVYVEQENAGVGAACNAGLALARGAFVNFMGADDKWSEGAFEEAAEFFAAYPQAPLVSFRMIFFEAATGNHILNFKYDHGTQLIDIKKRFDCPQIEGGSAIIRREAIPRDTFNGSLLFSEDLKLVSDVILAGGCYGVLSRSSYYYRKRLAATAATDHGSRGYDWHFDSLTGCHKKLFDYSKQLYGEVIPYIQFVVMYDLQWRMGYDAFIADLDPGLAEDYKVQMSGLLKCISDRVISRQRNLSLCDKLYALALRHDVSFSDVQKNLRLIGDGLYFMPPHRSLSFEQQPITRMANAIEVEKIFVHRTELHINDFHIMGTVNCLLPFDQIKLNMKVNGVTKEVPLKRWTHTGGISSFCEKDYFCFPSFEIDFSLDDQHVSFEIEIGGVRRPAILVFCRFAFLSTVKSYHYEKGYLFKCLEDGTGFTMEQADLSKKDHFALEKAYVSDAPSYIMSRSLKRLRKRAISCSHKAKKKQIWIIMDHLFDARDNGRALFEYLQENPPKNAKVYFALSGRSSQYAELKRKGNVLDRDSIKYMKFYLQADVIASSRQEEFVYRPFGVASSYMNDLEHFRFFFLQHGTILHDLSPILKRTTNRVDVFLTSSKFESKSISKEEYLYEADQIALTGQPRTDLLQRDSKVEKIILIMPTWRTELVLPFENMGIERMGRRANPRFADSDFCRFYNNLLSDERLLAFLRSAGYRVAFCLHPDIAQQKSSFCTNDVVSVLDSFDYAEILSKSALLVTDYSSIACDFALLKRPVLYNHFDADEYFTLHGRRLGHFSYEKNGFGKICFSKDELVDAICDQIAQGCIMEKQYQDRVDDFGFMQPGVCCETVVKTIELSE